MLYQSHWSITISCLVFYLLVILFEVKRISLYGSFLSILAMFSRLSFTITTLLSSFNEFSIFPQVLQFFFSWIRPVQQHFSFFIDLIWHFHDFYEHNCISYNCIVNLHWKDICWIILSFSLCKSLFLILLILRICESGSFFTG